jgi:hypothetical protein
MAEMIDYSTLTLEELKSEEKKIKNSEVLSAGLIGFLIGVMFFGVAKGGFGFLYTVIPIGLGYMVYKNSQKQKLKLSQIKQEIAKKS